MIKLFNKNNEEVLVVGINGFARVGKDTVSDFWLSQNNNVIVGKFSFATPLKKAASEMFSVPLCCFYDEKELVDPFWGITRREMLQKIGTECGRLVFFDDIWIKNLQKRVEESNARVAIVPDVRFDNEAEWINNIENSMMVNVSREGIKKEIDMYKHVSEKGIQEKYINYKIKNETNLNDLKNKSLDLLLEINRRLSKLSYKKTKIGI